MSLELILQFLIFPVLACIWHKLGRIESKLAVHGEKHKVSEHRLTKLEEAKP